MMKKTLVLLSAMLLAGTHAAAQTAGERGARGASHRGGRVVRVGPRTTYLKEGLSTEDVMRLLGRPAEVSERLERGAVRVSYVFERGEGRVLVAEFADGLLVSSRVETRPEGVRASVGNF